MHSDTAPPDPNTVSRLYRSMLRIRRVEEYICEIYASDVIVSPVHLSIGQEAVAVGICDVLGKDDMISSTYRCHAITLAKGGDLRRMMAELYGRSGGYAGGKAGSMHLIDMPHGVMGASAVVGTTIPVATGYALGLKFDAQLSGQKQRVVACVFGDGATEEGCFYESLNFAALHRLPILFVCENNGLAIHSPLTRRWSTDRLCERVETFGISTYSIGDGNVFAIHKATSKALSTIRSGNGPVFLECKTHRWKEHVGTSDNDYADPQWRANDPLTQLEGMLLASDVKHIRSQVEAELADAVVFAQNSPYPDDSQLLTGIYAATGT